MRKESMQSALLSQLHTIESTILNLEGIYLERSSNYGNLFKGYTMPNSIIVKKTDKDKARKPHVNDKNRLFSLSSCTSEANTHLKRNIEQKYKKQNSTIGSVELVKRNKGGDILAHETPHKLGKKTNEENVAAIRSSTVINNASKNVVYDGETANMVDEPNKQIAEVNQDRVKDSKTAMT